MREKKVERAIICYVAENYDFLLFNIPSTLQPANSSDGTTKL